MRKFIWNLRCPSERRVINSYSGRFQRNSTKDLRMFFEKLEIDFRIAKYNVNANIKDH